MCGRAELAMILASLALAQGAIDPSIFSVLIFTMFLLNLFTPLGLKGCSVLLEDTKRLDGGALGVLLPDKFGAPPPPPTRPDADGTGDSIELGLQSLDP